jgi:hypothetical protein
MLPCENNAVKQRVVDSSITYYAQYFYTTQQNMF